jgi:hypothetical protein
MTEHVGPYAEAAHAYWQAGWRGIMPLPFRKKKTPPDGYSGAGGADTSWPDVMAWCEGREGAGNIALRLPARVVGLDVDNYAGKPGLATIKAAEDRWGELPATWFSTNRSDGVSGISFYRTPEGLAWPEGLPGGGVDVIRRNHRYAVVAPSLHPEGRTYRWFAPDGSESDALPVVDDLPELPEAWIGALTAGELESTITRGELAEGETLAWLAGLNEAPACEAMERVAKKWHDALADAGDSRHDVGIKGVLALVRLGGEGHKGAIAALGAFHEAWTKAVLKPPAWRKPDVAKREWMSALYSAVNVVSVDAMGEPCTCDKPLARLVIQPMSGPVEPAVNVPETDARKHTSWWPVDMAAVLAGENEQPEPTHLARDDGSRLFYSGRINGLLGESESGKSWVALVAVEQALQVGEDVMFLDFEDSANGIVGRLRLMGVPASKLRKLHYIGPDESLHALASTDLAEALSERRPSLIVLDGFNAAMTVMGLDLQSNTDATKFAQSLLTPLTKTGAAVVTVDHVPKNKDARGKGGIGAQAKRAMTTGCAIAVEVVTPFGRGMSGTLKLTVDKDRPGHVRANCAYAKEVGSALITSCKETGDVSIRIQAPELRANGESGFKPTILMQRVSDYLATMPTADVSTAVIKHDVTGRNEGIVIALQALTEDGYITRSLAAKQQVVYRHVRCYPDRPTRSGVAAAFPVPTRSLAVPGNGEEPVSTRSPFPPPKGNGNGTGSGGQNGSIDSQPVPDLGRASADWDAPLRRKDLA